MLTFAYYVLKILICSGVLYLYYLAVLRNKIFHSWNRFYLIAVVILSLVAPIISIDFSQEPLQPSTPVVHLIQSVNTNDEFVYQFTKDTENYYLDVNNIFLYLYLLISAFLLALLIQTLLTINKLKNRYQSIFLEGIKLFNTTAKGTPFSFFNNIFWNSKIDIHTSAGKQIFKHEVAHVREKHSYDKIFMNIVLIFYWCNPIFWIIKKELNMIHEFIADKKAIEEGDTEAFALMILRTTYPSQQFSIANNFFYSPLKRRLLMLTKNKSPKITYLSRLLVLPLATVLFFAFTLKAKMPDSPMYTGKTITVIIDAGHGGSDAGASINNVAEKALTLSLAKVIKELNKNGNIDIVLTRNEDNAVTVKDRIEFAKSVNADLFISLHINAETTKNEHSGFTLFIPSADNNYYEKSKVLGSAIIESFQNNYHLPVADNFQKRENGIQVLDRNVCPSVLIEAGFLTTSNDFQFLIESENQKIIANNILSAIEKYAQQNLSAGKGLNENRKQHAGDVKNSQNNVGKIIIASKLTNDPVATIPTDTITPPRNGKSTDNNLVLRNFKSTEGPEMLAINADVITFSDRDMKYDHDFELIIVNGKTIQKNDLKGKLITAKKLQFYKSNHEEAVRLYGAAAKNGVMVFTDAIITENAQRKSTDTLPEKVFKNSDITPSFPGGESAWNRYIKKVIERNLNELTADNKSGTCWVRFIVATDGSVSDVHAITMQGTKLAEVAVNAIRRGPKCIPGRQHGLIVNAYKDVPVTFITKQEKTPSDNNKPIVALLGQNGGKMSLEKMKGVKKLETNSDQYLIESFTVYFSGQNFPYVKSYQQRGATFDQGLKKEWESLQESSMVTFDNIVLKNRVGKIIDVQGSGFLIAKN